MFNSLCIAFATYSRLPTPRADWNERSLRYAVCFFPLIGAVIGALEYGWLLLAGLLGCPAVLRGAGKAVIPMISMLSFWCVVRVAILHFAVPVYRSIDVVNWVYPITWCMSTVFLVIYFFRADWLHSFDRQNT